MFTNFAVPILIPFNLNTTLPAVLLPAVVNTVVDIFILSPFFANKYLFVFTVVSIFDELVLMFDSCLFNVVLVVELFTTASSVIEFALFIVL